MACSSVLLLFFASLYVHGYKQFNIKHHTMCVLEETRTIIHIQMSRSTPNIKEQNMTGIYASPVKAWWIQV